MVSRDAQKGLTGGAGRGIKTGYKGRTPDMAIHKSHPDDLVYWREATNDDDGAIEEGICGTCDEVIAKVVNNVIRPTSAGKRPCN